MKKLAFALISVLFSLHAFSQGDKPIFRTGPNGERFTLTCLTNRGVVYVSTKSIDIQTYDLGEHIYTPPLDTDIVDAREKMNPDGSNSDIILVLLSNAKVVELNYHGGKYHPKYLDPLGISGLTPYQILGDDLYIRAYEGIFVSDSGYNWKIDTAGLKKNPIYYDMDIDTSQRVWLCTSNGLFTQELNVTTWIKNTNYTGVGCDHVFIDRKQNVWVSYFNTLKVSRNRGLSFQNAPTGLPGNAIRDLCDDAFGNLYAMHDNKLYYSQGGTQAFVQVGQAVAADFTRYTAAGIFNNIVGDTLIYLSTDAGLYTSANQGSSWIYGPSIRAAHIGSVATTSDNRLLMTTNTGLFRNESTDSWTKRYPQTGFVPGSMVYTTTSGDIYLLAERLGANTSGAYRHMVYKSTDKGNTFSPDTMGIKARDIATTVFFMDEDGVQHASATVNTGGYFLRVWKKHPGQAWELDTAGLPALMNFNYSPQCFGSGNNGKVYIAIKNSSLGYTTIYSRPIAGGSWTTETGLTGSVFTIKGKTGVVTAGTEAGMIYNTGSGWKTAPKPSGVASLISWCLAEVDKNKVAWAYFETYDNSGSIGEGVYYTSDFSTWKKAFGSRDTILYGDLVALGDSVFATTAGNDGVDVFKTGGGAGISNIAYHNRSVVVQPNPFHESTILKFDLENPGKVGLIIYNTLGEIVMERPLQQFLSGMQQLEIKLSESPNGIFFYELRVNGAVSRGKIMKE